MNMRLVVVLLAVAIGCSLAEKKSYRNYHLMRMVPVTEKHVQTLKRLESDFVELDFWTEPNKGRPCDINVPPQLVEYVTNMFGGVGMTPETIHQDLQKLIDKNSASVRKYASDGVVETFARHGDIDGWLQDMARQHPELASTDVIGQSYEGRDQRMIRVGTNSNGGNKPIIWLDSAIHAREWLTVGTVVWIINKMLTTYHTDKEVRELMDKYDWYFLPVANPDGYEYTHTNDRLWRKTRTRNSFSSCRGSDPNRNWDFHWRESGTSTNPCSDTYGGAYAFSEPCVINMKNEISRVASRVKLYMGVHSYSQMWLTPWAYGHSKPSDYSQLLAVANAGNDALYGVHRKRYEVGTPPDILYAASGGAYDWAKGVEGIKYSYTYELRPDGNAWNGFVVDESEIKPTGEEIWASLVGTMEAIESQERQ